jgi:hypothetical protein
MNRKFFITLGYILSLVLFIVCTLIYIQHKDDNVNENEKINDNANDINRVISYRTYSCERYSIDYPDNWRIETKPNSTVDIYVEEQTRRNDNFNFNVIINSTDKNIDKIKYESDINFRNAGIFNSSEFVLINNYIAVKTKCSFTEQGKTGKCICYAIESGSSVYVITFTGYSCDFYDKDDIIDTIIKSFKTTNKEDNYNETQYFVVGDFNGDNIQDTIFESYINPAMIYAIKDWYYNWDEYDEDISEEYSNFIEENKPVVKLYSSIAGIDAFIVSDSKQAIGIKYFVNLGDINSDKSDELGYIIDYVQHSPLNDFYILTLKKNKFQNILSISIHEGFFEDEGLNIKQIAPKTIEYTPYMEYDEETGEEIERMQYTFE